MSKPRIAVILSSTRDSRFGAKPAEWILEKAKARGDWDVELVDMKDFELPMFNEMASNAWMPSADPKAVAWQQKIASFDGYIFVIAEYNHSISGALKNALDQAYVDWNRKAFGIVGYGALGAARAAEHLRNIAVELHMASTRTAVHIAAGDFFTVHPLGGNPQPISAIEGTIGGAADAMMGELDWWTRATMSARAVAQSKAA